VDSSGERILQKIRRKGNVNREVQTSLITYGGYTQQRKAVEFIDSLSAKGEPSS